MKRKKAESSFTAFSGKKNEIMVAAKESGRNSRARSGGIMMRMDSMKQISSQIPACQRLLSTTSVAASPQDWRQNTIRSEAHRGNKTN